MYSENNRNQEKELEQIIASSPNYRTEEEAIALASSGGSTVDRQAARAAVAGAFREELGHAMEPGAKVMSADRELRYCLELQRDRIARKNIRFTEEFDPGKKPVRSAVNNVRSWQDGHYETSWSVGYINHKKTAERSGMKTFKRKDPQSICETVIDVRNGEDVSGDTYCCPNCGAVSTIRELQEGCSQCGTSFHMTELYPKVGNYFFVPDPGVSTEPIWKTVTRCGLCSLPVTLILFAPIVLQDPSASHSMISTYTPENWVVPSLARVIAYIVTMIVASPIIGYFVWFLSLFFAGFKTLGKETPAALSVGSSRKRFASRMATISPAYTFETFSSKITTLFRILVFSDSRESLPFNAVKELGTDLDDVVDCTFHGWMSCKKIKVENNNVYVTGDVFVDTTRDMGDRLKVKSEVYQITAARRTDVPFSTNFSIARIQCPSCGASFNSFKSKNCPYCGKECEPPKEEWVICDVKNVGKKYLFRRIFWIVVVIAILALSVFNMLHSIHTGIR
ncbi:MAG: hypothetical protein IKZ90_07025 [Clostridiales bacterium]|nr:hypothetical protein [Clostridiales bacterium]